MKSTTDESSIGPVNDPRLFNGDSRVPLEAVISTDELRRRESRPADYEAENRALVSLMQEIANSRENVLQKLVETARNLCGAHSAGISILEEDNGRRVFRWHAVAGQWSHFLGSTMPRAGSPRGTVLDRNSALLLSHPERHYPSPPEIAPPIVEVLLIPFHVADEPVGTIWVIAHDESCKFDREDQRLLTSLGTFASAAYQLLAPHKSEIALTARQQELLNITAHKQAEEMRARLVAIVDSCDDAIVGKTLEGVITSWNRGAERIFGYTAEEAVGQHISLIIPKDRKAEEDEVLARLRRGEKIDHFETERQAKDGRKISVSLTVSPIRNSEGDVIGASKVARDITERKQVEQELRNRREELTAFFENASIGLHWVRADGIIKWANPAELTMLGYTKEEYEGHHIAEFHADQEVLKDILRRLVCGEKLNEYEARLRCKDGSIRNVLIDSSVLWEEGRFVHTQCFTRDITQQKQIEAALRESEERFRHMADNAPVMIWVTDRDGLCTYLNKSWYDFTGQTSETGLGEGWLDSVHPEDRDRVRATFFAAAEKQEPYRLEYRLRHKEGEYCWALNAAAPRFDASEELSGYIGSAIDITERKQAEETLKRAQRQSEELNTVLEARVAERTADLLRTIADRERLQNQLLQAQKMESVGTLASGVAHDFNNLLNIILSHATIMRLDGKNPARISEGAAVIEETVRRGATLVQQLMTLGRKSETKFVSVQLNSLAGKLAALLTETFPKTIVITLESERGLPAINGDENQLHQALLNLCVNARDAMPEGGRISFKTETVSGTELRLRFPEAEAARYVSASVSDSGSGMDDATQGRIFEPFFTTKPVGQGTGLGLAVVYGIVKNHSGFVEVKSRVGHGTTFALYLPIAQEAERRTPETGANVTARVPAGRGETILFVDDEEQQLKVMRHFLESEGYKILGAKDGSEALETFKQRQNEIAVTVLDLGLPKLGGWQTLEQMRAIRAELKVLIATGFISPEIETEMAQGKLSGVIAKPYQLDDVLGKISQAIYPRES